MSELEYTLGSGLTLGRSATYSYNLPGNITQIVDGDGDGTVTYTYDDLERLTEERYQGTITNDWEETNYVYDTAGNIRSVIEEEYEEDEVVSSTTHTYSYDDANWLDLLTAYDGVSLTYDAIGNPLSYYNGTSYTMTWAKGRQLASVSMGDETTGTTAISYAYDMDGIRSRKTVGSVTTEFVTQSGLVAQQSWSGNTIDFFYDAQQHPYAMSYTPAGGRATTYYYLTNLQGDVIALLNSSGSVVAEYEYGAWGAGTSAISSGFSAVAATTTTATGIVAQKGMQAGANVILSDISYILQSARENESTFTGLAISSVGGFISGTSYNLSGLSALGVSVGIEASGYVEGFVIQLFGNRS